MDSVNVSLPRGVRNNNPGNVKFFEGQEEWFGQIGVDKDGFVICAQPWQGYRIINKTLKTYQRKRLAADGSAIDTVTEVIQRWAPAGSENPHQGNYIAFVLRRLGIAKGTHIDCEDFATACGLASAIGQFETGMDQPFGPDTDKHIRRGVIEAGIEPYELNDAIGEANMLPSAVDHKPMLKPLRRSRTISGVAIAGPAAVMSMVAEHADEASAIAHSPLLTKLIDYAPWVLGAIALAALVWIVMARLDDREKGVR